ncbi:hypothetical protein QTP70_015470 [Hemibagrus guttatus]|uniref:Ig-like domain-containing protein n=1 Tax=Hemibagrus guttatus TaxID=175788 RepID=A0AAE0Q4B1_9TELE|nr:hypothetical protein QTP70_015470 [Hemibagrus guttatus]
MCCLFVFTLFISTEIRKYFLRIRVFSVLCAAVGSQTLMKLSLQTGAMVTIPCHYDRGYINHKKYWCYNHHSTFSSCSIQAYANETKGKVTVTDNPAESFFTVTMKDVQTENTGWYWCAVELTGLDVKEDLHITVKSDPDLSVRESRVRGEEGGSVTVQCLYSTAYQDTQKQWFRFKDGSCNTVGTKTSQNSAVTVSDDGNSSFSVMMSGLNKSDAGWYWCSAGDLQVPVHINVTDPPPVLSVTKETETDTDQDHSMPNNLPDWLLVAVGLGLLLILVSTVIYLHLRKTCKKDDQTRTRMKSNDFTAHTPPSALDREDVTYSSVFKAANNQTPSLIFRDDEVTYGNVISSTVVDDDVTYGNVNSPKIRGDGVIYSTVMHE